MPKLTLYSNSSAVVRSDNPTTNYSSNATEVMQATLSAPADVQLYASFSALDASLWYKKLTNAQLYVYMIPEASHAYCGSSAAALARAFDEATVTYNTPVYPSSGWISGTTIYGGTNASGAFSQVNMDTVIGDLLRYGVAVKMTGTGSVVTSRGTNKPYIVLDYEDTEVGPLLTGLSPRSGYVPKNQNQKFSWSVIASGTCYGQFSQSAATFRWRASEGASQTEINCGTVSSYTMPANTVTTDSFQWQVTVTTNTGKTLTSSWCTLSTVEPASTAQVISPVNIIVDGTRNIEFSWQHIISTGTEQTKYDLQYSTDGSVFTALQSESTSKTAAVVPANSLPSGDVWWRVRTYNTDNVAGAWSEAVKLVVIAAPAAPSVSVSTASPRPVIQWQSADQQAYEATIGPWVSGLTFGVDKTLRCGVYLQDGTYTALIRVQNKYGLWSEPGTVGFSVANTPGAAVTLTARPTHIAELSWTTSGAYDLFYIYRDNVLIAKTNEKTYVDHTSFGTISYQVRGAYANSDNYGLSNTVTVTLTTDTVMIADLEHGQWLALPYAETSARDTSLELAHQVAYMNFVGQTYPSIERSDFIDKSMTVEVAFAGRAESLRFEALLGKLVCVKDRRGDMIIGVLTGYQKKARQFYDTYSTTIVQVAYDGVVEHD